MSEKPALELELHAYVDGDLDEEAMLRIEEYLRDHPEAAQRVWDYLRQKDDIRRFALQEVLNTSPTSAYRLGKTLAKRLQPGKRDPGKRILAVAFVFLAGWLGHSLYQPLISGPSYAEEVVQAHLLSSSDPADVPPLSPERLSKLFARIGELQRLPDLRAFGLVPVGAQLLPSDEGPVLHIPYRGQDGSIVSYFLLHRSKEDEIDPHHVMRDGITVYYWQHEHSHHALAAPWPEDRMEDLVAHLDDSDSSL